MEDVVARGFALAFTGVFAVIKRLPAGVLSAGARALFSKSWKTFEHASQHVEEVQRARMLELCSVNASTVLGREHAFADVRGWDQFNRVPVRSWADYAPYVRRMLAGEKDILTTDEVFFYARSSGTTGEPKNVPVTQRYLDEFRHPRRVWLRQVAQHMPTAIRGNILTVHSPSIEGRTQHGVPYGSITVAMGSGREDHSGFDPVPRDVFRLPDHASRYYAALRFALQKPISVMAAVNPSTLVLLCQVMRERATEFARDLENGTLWDGAAIPDAQRDVWSRRMRKDPARGRALMDSLQKHGAVRPRDIWPTLAGALCWKGGSAPFYLAQLKPLLGDVPIMDYGYAASEGSFTVPMDAGDGQGVASVAGHVLQFIPWDAYESGSRETLGLWELKQGGRYVVVISGGHGLMRYDMQDVVQVQGFHGQAPILAFLHKAGGMVSITGEKLAESQVVEAVAAAAGAMGLSLAGFSLAPRLENPPHYVLGVEPLAPLAADTLQQLVNRADEQLQKLNIEYQAKRQSLRLGVMHGRVLTQGAFARHRALRVSQGAPDAHLKAPHLLRTFQALEDLDT